MIGKAQLTNTFTGGMDMDTDVTLLTSDKYRYAENVRLMTNDKGSAGTLLNIEGVKLYNTNIPTDETIIGVATVKQYAVIFTKCADGRNKIYRVTDFDSPNLSLLVILQGYLGLCDDPDARMSIIANYEGDDNIKIYFTDGTDTIRVFNIMNETYAEGTTSDLVDEDGNIINDLVLDITPGAILEPPYFRGLSSGNLTSGVVQYCYQLFNVKGTETTVSPLSKLIHLTDHDTSEDTQDYMGQYPDENSGLAVNLEITLHVNDFERCRIMRIHYSENNLTPTINIVDEFDITNSQDSVTYIDFGNSYLSELSIDEFTSITGYLFTGKTMAKMDNRLFVANITETSWDPGYYDARAYRCNSSGITVLLSSSDSETLTFQLATYDLTTIPEEHDCINPYNSVEFNNCELDELYIYGTDGVLGGHGLNIDYKFITTNLNISDSLCTNANGLFTSDFNENNCRMGISSYSSNTNTIYVLGDIQYIYSLDDSNTDIRTETYADPGSDSEFRSYQRDEIYRFGIVFYNNKSITSPVYWIADIKMPHPSHIHPFQRNSVLPYFMSRPLGILFTVRNIPKDAIAFDIVRCDRTEADRSVIMQTVGSHIFNYRILENENLDFVGKGDEVDSSIETRPLPFFYNAGFRLRISNSEYAPYTPLQRIDDYTYLIKDMWQNNYMALISPEICLQGEDIEDTIKNTYLDFVGTHASIIDISGEDTAFNVGTIGEPWSTFATPKVRRRPYSLEEDMDKVAAIKCGPSERHHYVISLPYMNARYYFGGVDGVYDERTKGYLAMISKYFTPIYDTITFSSISEGSIITAKPIRTNPRIEDLLYPPNIPYNVVNSVDAYKINVGTITYTNISMSSMDVNDDQSIMGLAGPRIIAYIPELEDLFSAYRSIDVSLDSSNSARIMFFDKDDIDESIDNFSNRDGTVPENNYALNAIPIFNIKKNNRSAYGGNSYASRLNSTYISTHSYTLVDGSDSYTTMTFGGDTYLGLLDYPNTFIFLGNNSTDWDDKKFYVGSYIPFESSINLNLMMGSQPHRTYEESTTYLDPYMQLDPTQLGTYHTQNTPFFEYNAVYSVVESAQTFVSNSIYAESNEHFGNRIVVSSAKTADEVNDSWTYFAVGDYLDVDAQWGDISNLKVFKDKLFFFQDDAVGMASVNERSLITDNNNNEIVLGTGGILSRYDYLSLTNGSSIINDRSIVNSDDILYWYDFNKNEICSILGSGVTPISKTGMVLSYLNEMAEFKRNNALTIFDKKYNEMWFNIYDKALILNENLNKFTSFYTFDPDWALTFSDRIILVKSNNYYRTNTLDTDNIKPEDKISKIQFIVNKDYPNTKVFDNILVTGEFRDKLGKDDISAILKYIQFATKELRATLDGNIVFDYREDNYRLPIPRQDESELDLSLSYPARMRGKYLMCEYHFDANDDKLFKIPQITTTYRYSLV